MCLEFSGTQNLIRRELIYTDHSWNYAAEYNTIMKKLYRSRTNKMVAGVSGGIGEYLNIDPTIVRIVWLVALIIPPHFFLEVLLYCVLWAVIPKASKA